MKGKSSKTSRQRERGRERERESCIVKQREATTDGTNADWFGNNENCFLPLEPVNAVFEFLRTNACTYRIHMSFSMCVLAWEAKRNWILHLPLIACHPSLWMDGGRLSQPERNVKKDSGHDLKLPIRNSVLTLASFSNQFKISQRRHRVLDARKILNSLAIPFVSWFCDISLFLYAICRIFGFQSLRKWIRS